MLQNLVHYVYEQVQCNTDEQRIRLIFSDILAEAFSAVGNRDDAQ